MKAYASLAELVYKVQIWSGLDSSTSDQDLWVMVEVSCVSRQVLFFLFIWHLILLGK